jgi:hypothetical protein
MQFFLLGSLKNPLKSLATHILTFKPVTIVKIIEPLTDSSTYPRSCNLKRLKTTKLYFSVTF